MMHGKQIWRIHWTVVGILALFVACGCSTESNSSDDAASKNADCLIPAVNQPAIETYLPDLASVVGVSASLVQSRGPDVEVKISESDWTKLFALLADSRPVDIECELSLLVTMSIETKTGDRRLAYVYDNYPPIVYAVTTKSRLQYFATDTPREDVLAFFIKDNGDAALSH